MTVFLPRAQTQVWDICLITHTYTGTNMHKWTETEALVISSVAKHAQNGQLRNPQDMKDIVFVTSGLCRWRDTK